MVIALLGWPHTSIFAIYILTPTQRRKFKSPTDPERNDRQIFYALCLHYTPVHNLLKSYPSLIVAPDC